MTASAPDQRSAVPPIVLLVERDQDSVEYYSRCFENAGVWVAVISQTDEALAAAEDLRPDLIVADADGQESTGEDVVEALKRHPVLGRVPVIAMTSMPQTMSHADSVLIKPVPPSLLLHRTKELIARARQMQQQTRDLVAHGRQTIEHSSRLLERSAEMVARRPDRSMCPGCGSPLEWVEEGAIGGATYDYYRWCLKGCGLYCFERGRAAWVKLA